MSATSSPTRFSARLLEAWKKRLDWFGMLPRQKDAEETSPELLYVRARSLARAGDLAAASRLFARIAEMAPTMSDAFEAQGEILDMEGHPEQAVVQYEVVRKLRSSVRQTAPDRTFVLRHRRHYTAEIAAYTSVLHSIRRHALPHIARGNAYLAEGRPIEALMDYDKALQAKPGLPDVQALKGEALVMLGQYEKALAAFDAAVVGLPRSPEVLSGRAIARIALGRIGDADEDWRRQFDLLSAEQSAARACVALRMGDYEKALPELERALLKEPNDPYWTLYRLVALKRLGRTATISAMDELVLERWPGPLLALHAGTLSAEEVLAKGEGAERQAEALFQVAVLASDSTEVRRYLTELVEKAPVWTIEFAAAKHELARLGPK